MILYSEDRLQVFAQFVANLASLSKCTDKQVAAIITDEAGMQIYSIGVNGGPAGGPDCLCGLGGKYTCAHAEANALAKCTTSCKGKIMICSLSPCVTCATLIINSGIMGVVYLEQYRDDSGIKLLSEAGVGVWQFTLK
jgi:dCMP deaminase